MSKRTPPRGKNASDRVTGLKRVLLQSSVDMKLFVDGDTGFPGGAHDLKPHDVKPRRPVSIHPSS